MRDSISHTLPATSDRHPLLTRTRIICLPAVQTVSANSVQDVMGCRCSVGDLPKVDSQPPDFGFESAQVRIR